ncbi:MAG: hypothetical protein MPN21_23755 [Thermoanaerobaculia bacterium]|nr:hypothetical protein [Thermoanaerobaculia bacterium]
MMKPTQTGAWIVAVLSLLLGYGPALAESKNRIETENLIVEWIDGASADAIAAAQLEGEKFFAAVGEMLGHEPHHKITILLRGPAEQPDGSWGYPHVDSTGRVHLFRFGPTHHSYLSSLAHELVHVFRIHRRSNADWFFEEGFAEFVALHVDPSLCGFPWYEFPVALAAGQWFARDEAIPLTVLRQQHRRLNLPCKAQSYTLRSSFFYFLGQRYGDDLVLQMAQQSRAGALEDYRRFFGTDFEALLGEWQESLVSEYRATEDAEEQARRYRQETPIQYMEICQSGTQF